MARSRIDPGGGEVAPDVGWAGLTWADLEGWAGSRSVARGRAYQRGGRVKDLTISRDGELLATVAGGERYATTVALGPGRRRTSLESACTCPVGAAGCKHAVAVVAEYLQAVADGREVPAATEDDPRRAELDGQTVAVDDDWGDEDDGASWDEDDHEDARPARKARGPNTPSRHPAVAVSWDDEIERHLRAKTQGELADLAWSLVRRFPEIHREFRERIALQRGDVDQLLAEARREIRKVTSEPAWRNHWDNDGHIPDYDPIKHRLERLLELGHADGVVSLGRDLIEGGMRQVGESHDEGETARTLAGCLSIVFRAVASSSLPRPERLLFAIDAELADGYDVIDGESAPVFDAPSDPEDWSTVADTLARRLKAAPARGEPGAGDFSRDYHRDRVTGWIATALAEAGRDGELRILYESEARATGSHERLVAFLIGKALFEDAERWAREGIAATRATLPGIASSLAASLCELAQRRKQWGVVAAHAARKFFSEYPGPSTFDDLMKAARKAKVEGSVRAAALRFLETGTMPYRAISPPAPAKPDKSSSRGRAASIRPATAPVPTPDRVEIDPAWPLPVPDYLIPLLDRPGRHDPAPRPRLDVLLQMAIAAKRPEEVLRWFDRMRPESPRAGPHAGPIGHADRVAEAVSAAYPERAIEIYLAALDAQLPHAQPSSYEAAAGYLRKLRPLQEAAGRPGDWAALLASIREKYRNRPRFMELLDGVDGRTIVQSTRTRRE